MSENENQNAVSRVLSQLAGGEVTRMTLSGAFRKDEADAKITITRLAGGYQAESRRGAQAFHTNFTTPADAAAWVGGRLPAYRQCDFTTSESGWTLLQSKKGAQTLRKTKGSAALFADKEPQTHNRQKPYLLPEGVPVPWLTALGIMLPDGTVPAARQKKFRQINRFLEMAEDIADRIPDKARIIDAGCGKSYLTFALYDYLRRVKNKRVEIAGLDLKADVVAHCAALAERFGFEHLRFTAGDIAEYTPEGEKADMVVSLHACDVATDYALANAVRWGADVILSVPCCQHELYPQVRHEGLNPLLRHGILKERFAALLTDALRAELLEAAGYSCTVMEFIDMEHTPKNLLLRAVRRQSGGSAQALLNAERLMTDMAVSPKLYGLLKGGGAL